MKCGRKRELSWVIGLASSRMPMPQARSPTTQLPITGCWPAKQGSRCRPGAPRRRRRGRVRKGAGRPRRFDEAREGAGDARAEVLFQQELPGVELEQRGDVPLVQVDEAAGAVQADVLDGDVAGVVAGRGGDVAQVVDRAAILPGVAHAGEVQRLLHGEAGEALEQAFLDRIELVGGGRQLAAETQLLQPQPLEEGRLVEGGGRVVVEFEQLGLAGPWPS